MNLLSSAAIFLGPVNIALAMVVLNINNLATKRAIIGLQFVLLAVQVGCLVASISK